MAGSVLKNIGKLFGLYKDKTESYGGTQPYKSIYDIPFTSDLLAKLQARSAGTDVGFDKGIMDTATAPYAKIERAGFQQQTAPTVTARASASGLGRSTIVPNILARESSNVEDRIAQRAKEVELANEEQKRQEIQNALTQLQGLTGTEVSTRAGGAEFERGTFADYTKRRDEAEKAQQEGLGRGLSLLAMGAGGFLAPAMGLTALQGLQAGSVLSNILTKYKIDKSDTDVIDEIIKKRNAAMVNI